MSRRRTSESPELALLDEVTQLLASAPQPERALAPLVTLVKAQMGTEVCSLYLLDPAAQELVLAATDGLVAGAVGSVRMQLGEGLTGLVAEARAPVSVAEAARHPRFRYFPETGEERYHSFLGVPLLRRGAVEGVLVVQTREARRFRRDEVRMLSAVAAQLAGHLAQPLARARMPARELPHRLVFPSVAAAVRGPGDVEAAMRGRPQALVAPASLGLAALSGVSEAAPGTVLIVSGDPAEVSSVAPGLREAARRSPLRFAVAGVTEPGDLAPVREALLGGAGGDLAVGCAVDSAATALSMRALSPAADFFLVETTGLARSATGGRSDDPFVPAVLRLVARALHAARESGRPSFVSGGLAEGPEGWIACAGYGVDVVVAPAASIEALRRFGRRLAPGAATGAARSALRTHSSESARAALAAEIPVSERTPDRGAPGVTSRSARAPSSRAG